MNRATTNQDFPNASAPTKPSSPPSSDDIGGKYPTSIIINGNSNGAGGGGGGGGGLLSHRHHHSFRQSPTLQNYHLHHHQPQSYDTLASSTSISYNGSEDVSDAVNSSYAGEEHINDLGLKFEQLQRQVETLTQTQTTQDERYKRSRQENEALLARVHGLEDQLRELELCSEIRAKEDEKRFRETMAKQSQKLTQECEQHLHANFLVQQELFEVKNDLIKSDALVKSVKSENEQLKLELQDKSNELTNLDAEIHKLKLQIKSMKAEESVKSNLISILNDELEDSHNRSQQQPGNSSGSRRHSPEHQSFHHNGDGNLSIDRTSSPLKQQSSRRNSVVVHDFDPETDVANVSCLSHKTLRDIDALETSLGRLKEENQRLKGENEELQAQMLNFQLEEVRSLVQEGNKSYSLADELGDIDVQKLMKALQEQQDDNARLKRYMEEILLKIVEKNPELLEKTDSADTSAPKKPPPATHDK